MDQRQLSGVAAKAIMAFTKAVAPSEAGRGRDVGETGPMLFSATPRS
jgi:hypothetical protein